MSGKKGELSGSVVWFNDGKGFGFIKGEDEADYFVHYSGIISDDHHKSLIKDQRVRFTPEQGSKGICATHVRVIGDQQSAVS